MTVSLNTEVQEEGVVLTIANGEQAGESAGKARPFKHLERETS